MEGRREDDRRGSDRAEGRLMTDGGSIADIPSDPLDRSEANKHEIARRS